MLPNAYVFLEIADFPQKFNHLKLTITSKNLELKIVKLAAKHLLPTFNYKNTM